MQFHSKQLPDGRWGIYESGRLLATIGCPHEGQETVRVLKQRQVQRQAIDRTDEPVQNSKIAFIAYYGSAVHDEAFFESQEERVSLIAAQVDDGKVLTH